MTDEHPPDEPDDRTGIDHATPEPREWPPNAAPDDIDPDENRQKSMDRMLDWLCWRWAHTGSRFHPPYATADECMATIHGDNDDDWPEDKYGVERGEHYRAHFEAVEHYRDLAVMGYDPIARARREAARTRAMADPGVQYDATLTWDWLPDEWADIPSSANPDADASRPTDDDADDDADGEPDAE